VSPRPSQITAHGLAVAPPSGWEAVIYRRLEAGAERTFPVLHAATVPLPIQRGDYGSGLVEMLQPDDVFVSLLEFGPEAAGSALFQATGLPGLTPDMYRLKQLQRVIPGQAGVQRFFTEAGRGFCLYSVIGSYANRMVLCARANQLIGSIHIQAGP
jgi:hypothetical protein